MCYNREGIREWMERFPIESVGLVAGKGIRIDEKCVCGGGGGGGGTNIRNPEEAVYEGHNNTPLGCHTDQGS